METNFCPRHKDTATNLRCGRCGELVCPQCLVHSPVGVRCPDCGRATRLPMYEVRASLVARAVLASLITGVVGGLAIALVVRPLPLGFLYLAVMAGFGYLISEAVGRAAAHKRGRTLQFIAAGGVLAALVVIGYLRFLNLFDLMGAGLAAYVAFIRLR